MNNPPNLTNYWREYPHKVLSAFAQENNSQNSPIIDSSIAHTTIGAGRAILQDKEIIDQEIKNNNFYRNKALSNAFDYAKKNNRNVHLIGLLSDVSRNASLKHLIALIEFSYRKGFKKLFVDCIADGYGESAGKLRNYIEQTSDKFQEVGFGQFSSICGRDYAMGRNSSRLLEVLRLLAQGKAQVADNIVEAIKRNYQSGLRDEKFKPTLIRTEDGVNPINNSDVIIFFNFASRAIKPLVRSFVDPNFQAQLNLGPSPKDLYVVTFTKYFKTINTEAAFKREQLAETLPEMLARYQKKDLRIAEKIKEPHVTSNFNGGRNEPFVLEERHIFDSGKKENFANAPEMAGSKITQDAISAIKSKKYDFILVNFANVDVIGHLGDIKLAGKAVLAVDKFVAQIVNVNLAENGITLISADHGIIEKINGSATLHTQNPVPFILITKEQKRDLLKGALSNSFSTLSKLISPQENLADIAPTILELLKIPKPGSMTGHSLLSKLE